MNYAPLYLQIAEQLRTDILNGTYPVGSLIPTEIQLEEMFKVSKITIRNAVKVLADEGFVQKKSGLGTRVIRDAVIKKMENVATFSEVFSREPGAIVTKDELAVIEVEKNDRFFPIFGKRFMRFTQRHFLNQRLVAQIEYNIPYMNLTEEDRAEWDTVSFQQFFAKRFPEPLRIRNVFRILEGEHEPFENDVLLEREQTIMKQNGVVIGRHIGIIDTSVYPYISEFEG